ncbi:hypothetical protein HME9302_01007 [Alteripontixanthobacter maritimus]|uniref:histidine kinase n=1 Tax=Alteripontixanthobacter maritimus TaxID=2161824 RepID=A0A369Q5Q1_9SPHN|nr:XrtA/PEP-CTERM system histidine kinase PrsK [Alteripontixanthobacter maritimus]RDC59812.1 hypothetical protein HME9302_01007 [Alteripontixanthobacter maritimus]
MTLGSIHLWAIAGSATQIAGAAACLFVAVWLWRLPARRAKQRVPVTAALLATALWCLVSASWGSGAPLVNIAETMRNLAWLHVIYRQFQYDGRAERLTPVKPLVFALALVEGMQPLLVVLTAGLSGGQSLTMLAEQVSALLRMLFAVGTLMLLHNVYSVAARSQATAMRWAIAALALLLAFDLNYYTAGYLGDGFSPQLASLRGLIVVFVAAAILMTASARSADLRLRPSRAVAFQTLSLAVIGLYFGAMVVGARSLSLLGGDLGRLAQVGFVVVAAVFALVALPSDKLRGWLRVNVVKHLFKHRYDYRAEWLRFTQTIGRADRGDASFGERVVQAMADITDSPSGLLLLPSDDGALELGARFNWPTLDVPPRALPARIVSLFERHEFILDMDEARSGTDYHGELPAMPDWLIGEQRAWAIVPLLHFDQLTGVVILARPKHVRRLDWEDFDLLRIAGRQLASYMAEQASQRALLEANQFDDFNRRIAFVMHDIKNLASQMSLLAGNAEKHADNPAFHADMLVTLRNSSDKLETLLARLGRYGKSSQSQAQDVDLSELARKVAAHYVGTHPVQLSRDEQCIVAGDPEALEQALIHIVGNSVDASLVNMPVILDVSSDALEGRIEVSDSGCGMSAEFIREGLFKPFVSTKEGGFGIGAYEARELILAMGGRLDVDAREGLGSRFVIRLPIAAAAQLRTNHVSDESARDDAHVQHPNKVA